MGTEAGRKGDSEGAGQVGWLGRTAYSCVTSNFGRSKLLRPNSVSDVLGLYGNPIKSRLQPCSFGGHCAIRLISSGRLDCVLWLI